MSLLFAKLVVRNADLCLEYIQSNGVVKKKDVWKQIVAIFLGDGEMLGGGL